MPWFRIDDSFPQHPKVLSIPRRDRAAAVGLWTLAGTWCAAQLTDGHLGSHMVEEFACTQRHADLLVKAGLWEVTDGGYQIHDYLDYNPSAAEVRADQAAKHAAKARAGRAGGIASGVARRKHEPSRTEAEPKQERSKTEAKRSPVPAPSASKEAERARARATATPDRFEITDDLRAWATEKAPGVDLERETEKFLDHHRAKGSTFKSWPAAWRTWMARADEYRGGNIRPLRTAPSDRRLTSDELNNLLGPDRWTCPDPPAGLAPDDEWEWRRQQQIEHIHARQAEARARLVTA